eukprot:1158756-Pelagomonas_calceolata.AAC.7
MGLVYSKQGEVSLAVQGLETCLEAAWQRERCSSFLNQIYFRWESAFQQRMKESILPFGGADPIMP